MIIFNNIISAEVAEKLVWDMCSMYILELLFMLPFANMLQSMLWTYILIPLRPRWDLRTVSVHSRRSQARRCASPQERFNSDSSDVIVFLQVVFGLPGFRLPGGVHFSATFGIRCWSMRRTWPSHHIRRYLISCTTLLVLVFLYIDLRLL